MLTPFSLAPSSIPSVCQGCPVHQNWCGECMLSKMCNLVKANQNIQAAAISLGMLGLAVFDSTIRILTRKDELVWYTNAFAFLWQFVFVPRDAIPKVVPDT